MISDSIRSRGAHAGANRHKTASRTIEYFTHIAFFSQFLCDAVLTDERFIQLQGTGADTR